jgi:hypothetical protein
MPSISDTFGKFAIKPTIAANSETNDIAQLAAFLIDGMQRFYGSSNEETTEFRFSFWGYFENDALPNSLHLCTKDL